MELVDSFPVRFVDGKDIANFQNACFDRLNVVSQAGNHYYNSSVRSLYDVDF